MTGWDWDTSGDPDINPKPTPITGLPEGEQPKPTVDPSNL